MWTPSVDPGWTFQPYLAYHHHEEQDELSLSHLRSQLPTWFWQYHGSAFLTWHS